MICDSFCLCQNKALENGKIDAWIGFENWPNEMSESNLLLCRLKIPFSPSLPSLLLSLRHKSRFLLGINFHFIYGFFNSHLKCNKAHTLRFHHALFNQNKKLNGAYIVTAVVVVFWNLYILRMINSFGLQYDNLFNFDRTIDLPHSMCGNVLVLQFNPILFLSVYYTTFHTKTFILGNENNVYVTNCFALNKWQPT